jgi:putative spermidine/putrescine transport system substrate-binding protein
MKFIAFASRAENQAIFAQHILYGPTNSRAFATIAADRAKLLPTSPDLLKTQVVQNYDFWNAAEAGKDANYKRAVSEWESWLAGAR